MIPLNPESDPILSLATHEREQHAEAMTTLQRLRQERQRVTAMANLQNAPGWKQMLELLEQQAVRATEHALQPANAGSSYFAGMVQGVRSLIRCLQSPDAACETLDRQIQNLEKILGKAASAASPGDQT